MNLQLIEQLQNIKSPYSKKLFGNVLLIIIVLMFVLTYYLNFDRSVVSGIVLLLFISLVAEIYLRNSVVDMSDNHKITTFKLANVQKKMYDYIDIQKLKNQELTESDILILKKKSKVESLYIDANIIHFLDNVLYFYDINPDAFYLMIKGINNILKLRNDIEVYYDANNQFPENCYELYEQANILALNVMNQMHSFIYNISKANKMYDEHAKIQNRLFVLIRRHTDYIETACKAKLVKEGISNNTKFFQKTSVPRPAPSVFNNFDLYV